MNLTALMALHEQRLSQRLLGWLQQQLPALDDVRTGAAGTIGDAATSGFTDPNTGAFTPYWVAGEPVGSDPVQPF